MTLMPAFFQRLNRREQVLSMIVGGALFLLLNLFIWSSLLGAASSARADVATRKAAREQQSVFLRERKIWEKREEWLKKNQPTLKSAGEASALLDKVKEVAGKHNILLENPAIGSSDSNANYQAVFASVETKSPWPPLVRFLYDLQQPEAFVVFENVQLAIDGTDPTMMRGKLKIARWFAPK